MSITLKCQYQILRISRHVLAQKEASWDAMFLIVISKFPHYWVFSQMGLHVECGKAEIGIDWQRSRFLAFKISDNNNDMIVVLFHQAVSIVLIKF